MDMGVEIDGTGGPTGWNARKQLYRPIRVDPRVDRHAGRAEGDVAFYLTATAKSTQVCTELLWHFALLNLLLVQPDLDPFPYSICDDSFTLGPHDFTEEQIGEYYVCNKVLRLSLHRPFLHQEDYIQGCYEPLVICNGDAVFSLQQGTLSGAVQGYAVGGVLFDRLNKFAQSLPTTAANAYTHHPQRFLAIRDTVDDGVKIEDVTRLPMLRLSHVGPRDKAREKKFNLLRERPERPGVIEYLGVYSFRVDRSPMGKSLNRDLLDSLDCEDKPDVIPIEEGHLPADTQRSFFLGPGQRRQKMLYYLPRAPFFEAYGHGVDERFLEKLRKVRGKASKATQVEVASQVREIGFVFQKICIDAHIQLALGLDRSYALLAGTIGMVYSTR
jgi:hypothetical protein